MQNTDIGNKDVLYGPRVLVEQDDAKLMKSGDTVTFINWGNIKIDGVKMNGDLVASVDATLDLQNTVRNLSCCDCYCCGLDKFG